MDEKGEESAGDSEEEYEEEEDYEEDGEIQSRNGEKDTHMDDDEQHEGKILPQKRIGERECRWREAGEKATVRTDRP